ncbi:efflux RND transporter periplasmic adaptor subunit [Kordiimonas pumila]|nr:efflux RND transporter periplasmic adaptor subunit [Kordiimonas pumila]
MIAYRKTKAASVVATSFLLAIWHMPLSAMQAMQQPPAQVEVAVAEKRMMAATMVATGTVISLNDSRIATEVEGPLAWIAPVGTTVKSGEVIAKIDDRLLLIAERQAKATLNGLKATLVYREQDVNRYERLAAQDNASKARLEEATASRDLLKEDIANAAAMYDKAVGDLERAQIKAPFPGHVVARIANKGEYQTVGSELVRLVDTSEVEVTMPVPISVTPYLKTGDMVAVDDGQTIRMLPIRTVVPVSDMVSRMVEVRLTAEPEAWVIGAPVKVSLPKNTPVEAVAIPRDAVILKDGQRYIYKVSDAMTATRVNATIQAVVGNWVSLESGIVAGDKIIIRGGERLMPGQSVAIN